MVEQIQSIGRDPQLVAQAVRQAQSHAEKRIREIEAEERRLGCELAGHQGNMQELLGQLSTANSGGVVTALQADIQERIQRTERRLSELADERQRLARDMLDEADAARALALFDPVWETLSPREQGRLLQLLIERIDYDGRDDTISITFQPSGIKALVDRDTMGDAA